MSLNSVYLTKHGWREVAKQRNGFTRYWLHDNLDYCPDDGTWLTTQDAVWVTRQVLEQERMRERMKKNETKRNGTNDDEKHE